MSRLHLILVALLATALVAAGCGDSGPSATETYKAAFTPLNAEIISTGNDVGQAVQTANTKTDSQIAVDFTRLSDSAAALAGQLVKLEPPKDLEADNTALIKGLRLMSGKLNRIADAAVQGDAAAAKTATTEMVQASIGIRDPRRRIAEALKLESP